MIDLYTWSTPIANKCGEFILFSIASVGRGADGWMKQVKIADAGCQKIGHDRAVSLFRLMPM